MFETGRASSGLTPKPKGEGVPGNLELGERRIQQVRRDGDSKTSARG